MYQPIRAQGGHFVFPIGPKNTNLVKDVEILLPVKFHWIPFIGFREEVENVSANQRPGRPSYFSDQPEKHKLGRARWDLTYCQVSEKKSKMSQPIRTQGGNLVFHSGQKNTNLLEDVEILLPVKFRWIPFSGFREVENVSANQRPGRPSCFSDRPKNTNLVEDIEILLPVKFHWILFSGTAVSEEKSKMSQPIRGQGGHLVFPIGPKNTNLVEDIEILLPVKFRWIPFSSFRKVENVKVNDGRTDRRTDDGQRVITIVHLSLGLSCTKKRLLRLSFYFVSVHFNPTAYRYFGRDGLCDWLEPGFYFAFQ